MRHKPFNNRITWGTLLSFCLWNIWLIRNYNQFNNKRDPISCDYICDQSSDEILHND
ncbi:hypothetical protein R3W88_027206 [Solanum pinnatisectum]|uniref:Uncharacterized protein n=1 Tax=Solanum pinnatisectum TaxID=50273 RepID=A0AAV9LGL1_9SOLN|nr:hypothetical protein R3W88_027206 [Solanum pinnatisectum]